MILIRLIKMIVDDNRYDDRGNDSDGDQGKSRKGRGYPYCHSR